MSELTKKALGIIDHLETKRAKDVENSVLKSMKAPVVDGEEQRNILNLFISDQYLGDDKNGNLASFVVMSPTDIPLIFFSLRCGELFEEISDKNMKICQNAYIALCQLENKKFTTKKEKENALNQIKIAIKKGFTLNDFESIDNKKKDWKYDNIIDANKETNKVFKSHPAVELKLLGVNVNGDAINYWNSLKLPNDIKMGETLFWVKVVKTLEEMMKFVGCEYVYLFAADKEAEGKLVKYYRARLGFDSNIKMTANKPRFDWMCQFLFQSLDDLFKRKTDFISKLNED